MAPLLRSALALFFLITSLVIAQDTSIPLTCHDDGVQIIAVVGENVANGSNSFGLTATFVEAVMSDIPGSSNFSVNYNRTAAVNATGFFIPECEQGAPAFKQALMNYTAACPKTPVVIHGYSEGAVIVMNVLCGASSGPFPVTTPLDPLYASHSESSHHLACAKFRLDLT